MKHKLILKYSTVWLDSLRNGKTELNNTNKLINKYNGMTGLKTGTTSNAGFCLCATATRDNISFVSVVLGAKTSDDRFDLTRQLLDYGFANYKIEEMKIDNSKIKSVRVKKVKLKKSNQNIHQTKRCYYLRIQIKSHINTNLKMKCKRR